MGESTNTDRRPSPDAAEPQQVLAVANELERLVIDLETGQRGFMITGDERVLRPWDDARRKKGNGAPQNSQGCPMARRHLGSTAMAGPVPLAWASAPLVVLSMAST